MGVRAPRIGRGSQLPEGSPARVADTIAGRICQGVEVVALASGGGADTIAARLIYKQFLFPGVEVAALAAASGSGADTFAAGSAGGASTRE